MEEWVPLFQSLIWPTIFVGLLLAKRDKVGVLLDVITDRIKKGDPFQAGPFGMGQSIPQDAYSPGDSPSHALERVEPDDLFSYGNYPEMPMAVKMARTVRLLHEIGPWSKDKDGITRRNVVVTLDTLPNSLLDVVDKVTYYLPESWPKRLQIQEKKDPSDNFLLKTRAYGEVTVAAKVEFKEKIPPIVINRYCNFYDQQS